MKYVIILPDGAADEPVPELDGLTPLEAAATPNIDWLAAHGRVGTVRTVPEGFLPGSDVATLSAIGYDPRQYYTGRAPLEAAARNLPVGPADVVFRCNLTTIVNGAMADFSAGHISQAEGEALIADLNTVLATDRIRFYPGVMYRHLMVLKDAANIDVACTPPHDIPGQPINQHLPIGKDADLIRSLMARASTILEPHEINRARRQRGESPATSIWLWGQGRMPTLPAFHSRYGVRGACITAVDLIRGIAALIGWPILPVPGATGYIDTNYRGKGNRAVEALDEFDLVCVHIEAPDEAGHNGDVIAKIRAIEQIDEHIVGPILERLRRLGDWRMLLMPDHPTPVSKRTHTADPPPFCIAGSRAPASVPATARPMTFSEADARAGGLHITHGHELMSHFLRG